MDRAQLKEWAKNAFHRSYWKSVLVAFILTITVGSGGSGGGSSSSSSSDMDFSHMTEEDIIVFIVAMLIVFAVIGVIWIIAMAVKAFVFNPLQVGCQSYFCKGLNDANPQLNELGRGFKPNYKNVALTMFLRDLYLWLWGLIGYVPTFVGAMGLVFWFMMSEDSNAVIWFVIALVILMILTTLLCIPWIIKTYQYMLIPYILADNPDMPRKQVFELTKQMMMGNKWKAFELNLSFLGWYLLCFCTCGILAIFYVEPYRAYTLAAFYKDIQQRFPMNGGGYIE